MIHDPKTPVPFKPDEDGPVTYLLRVPTVADRSEFRRQLRLVGARSWTLADVVDAAKAAVERLLPGEDEAAERQEATAALDAWLEEIREAAQAWTDERSDENFEALREAMNPKGAVKHVIDVLTALDISTNRPVDPATAERLADMSVFQERQGLVAARMFLVGWEGVENEDGEPVPFKRGLLGLSEATLARIPMLHLLAIGSKVQELLEPAGPKLGNSSSPSGGRSSRKSSSSPKTPRPNGRSPTATSTTAAGSAAAESA